MDTNQTSTSQLALEAATGGAQPSPVAAAEKAAAEKAAAEKAAAEKAAAEKAAAKLKKAPRPRRGPPADGGDETRVKAILSTSKLSDGDGGRLRRGQAVLVPERRLEALVRSGKVRMAPTSELAAAERRYGLGRLA